MKYLLYPYELAPQAADTRAMQEIGHNREAALKEYENRDVFHKQSPFDMACEAITVRSWHIPLENGLSVREVFKGTRDEEVHAYTMLEGLAATASFREQRKVAMFQRAVDAFKYAKMAAKAETAPWRSATEALIRLHIEAQQYDVAEENTIELLQVCEKRVGIRTSDTVSALCLLSEVYRLTGRPKAAQTLAHRAIVIATALPNKEVHLAIPLDALSQALLNDDNLSLAEQFARHSLAINEVNCSPNSIEVNLNFKTLASIFRKEKQIALTDILLARRIQSYLDCHELEHVSMSSAINELAIHCLDSERAKEVSQLQTIALAISEKSSGDQSVFRARDLANYGQILRASGEHENAIEIFRQAIALFESTPSDDKTNAMLVANNLAMALDESERKSDAIEIVKGVVAILFDHQNRSGVPHPQQSLFITTLRTLLGDEIKSDAEFETVLGELAGLESPQNVSEIVHSVLAKASNDPAISTNQDLKKFLSNIAQTKVSQEAIDAGLKFVRTPHIWVLKETGRSYLDKHEAHIAIAFFDRALEIGSSSKNSSETLESRYLRGKALRTTGESAKAEAEMKLLIADNEKSQSDLFLLRHARIELAYVIAQLGREDEAKSLVQAVLEESRESVAAASTQAHAADFHEQLASGQFKKDAEVIPQPDALAKGKDIVARMEKLAGAKLETPISTSLNEILGPLPSIEALLTKVIGDQPADSPALWYLDLTKRVSDKLE